MLGVMLLLRLDDLGHALLQLHGLVLGRGALSVLVEEEALHHAVCGQIPDFQDGGIDQLQHHEQQPHRGLWRGIFGVIECLLEDDHVRSAD